MDYSPWGRKELDTTEGLSTAQHSTALATHTFTFTLGKGKKGPRGPAPLTDSCIHPLAAMMTLPG